MAGRDDAIALIPEIDALSPGNQILIVGQLRSKGVYPPALSPGSEPSYYDVADPTPQQKADKSAFTFFLKQYSYRSGF